MSTTLLASGIWRKITSAAAGSASSANVAVAYFGAGATKLLPLKQGSRLVVDFSERAVKSGQTCPSEILKLIRRGVEVYSVPNLHAKVFVFRNSAFIGSTNVSQASALTLVEAVAETDDRKLIASMRQLVCILCLNRVMLHEAKQMESLYRPPDFAPAGGRTRSRSTIRSSKRFPVLPEVPAVRIAQTHHTSWDKDEWRAERAGKKVARKRITDTRHFAVDDFIIEGRCQFVRHETVIQVTDVGHGMKMVSPQGKVIHLQPVPHRRPMETVVFVEMPKSCRRKNLKAVVHRLGGNARRLLCNDRVIRDRSFVEKLLSLWRTTGDGNL